MRAVTVEMRCDRVAATEPRTPITSGRNGKLHEVDAAGTEVWRLELPANHGIYRVERIPELLVDVPGDTDGDGLADEEVIAALVAAINADLTLSAAGISAVANQNELTTNGTIDTLAISDPGLSGPPPAVPTLLPWGYALLAIVLVVAALAAQRRLPMRAHRRGE